MMDVMKVMNDPVAQELLNSSIPARLSYIGLDQGPRAIPIGFYWNGSQIVMATVPHSAKVRALQANPRVALTIDTNNQPPHVLLVRGTVTIEIVDGVPIEYLEGGRKFMTAEQYVEWEAGVKGLYKQMARIDMTPEWAKVMDFTSPDRIPAAVAELVNAAQS
jgi:pyridoxamine 5'-phosphate oxidase-like protein